MLTYPCSTYNFFKESDLEQQLFHFLTRLGSLLGGGFCLRFGDPVEQRELSVEYICNVPELHLPVYTGVIFKPCSSLYKYILDVKAKKSQTND